MSNRLYVDDMLVAEVPDSGMIVPSSLLPNAIKYQSSVSSTKYPPWKQLLHRTNCCNCGAPLPSNGKCMYCGTENDHSAKSEPFEPFLSEMNLTAAGITFSCFKDKFNPYMESVAVRDVQGRLHRKVVGLRE